MKSKNLIRVYDFENEFEDNDEGEKSIEALNDDYRAYKMSELGIELTPCLALTMITSYAFRGKVYFYFKKYETIIYPHDETGFGVINIGNSDQRRFGINFLMNAGNMHGFISHIERHCNLT